MFRLTNFAYAGGLVLATEQIARALIRHPAKLPFCTALRYERGTMLALASDEIVMDANAVLGPVDLSCNSHGVSSKF